MSDEEFLKQIRISCHNSSARVAKRSGTVEMHVQRWFNPVRAEWYWKFMFFDEKYDLPCVSHWSDLPGTIEYFKERLK